MVDLVREERLIGEMEMTASLLVDDKYDIYI